MIRTPARRQTRVPPRHPELRGVFQDSDSFPGVVLFKVVDSAGRLRLKVEMPEADVEIGFGARLEKWLDRCDPPAPSLRLVRERER